MGIPIPGEIVFLLKEGPISILILNKISFRKPLWKSMCLSKISRVTWQLSKLTNTGLWLQVDLWGWQLRERGAIYSCGGGAGPWRKRTVAGGRQPVDFTVQQTGGSTTHAGHCKVVNIGSGNRIFVIAWSGTSLEKKNTSQNCTVEYVWWYQGSLTKNISISPFTYSSQNHVYRKVSNISHTLVGYKIVDHSDVVGASPVGAAPTTSSFSTWRLASMDWAKTTARRDENHLCFGIGCVLY